MRGLIFLLVFAAGFAAGAWRAGAKGRGLAASAAMLPLVIFLMTGFCVLYLRVTAPVDLGMNELAYLATTVIGVAFALIAFAGGLFGAWFRRSDWVNL